MVSSLKVCNSWGWTRPTWEPRTQTMSPEWVVGTHVRGPTPAVSRVHVSRRLHRKAPGGPCDWDTAGWLVWISALLLLMRGAPQEEPNIQSQGRTQSRALPLGCRQLGQHLSPYSRCQPLFISCIPYAIWIPYFVTFIHSVLIMKNVATALGITVYLWGGWGMKKAHTQMNLDGFLDMTFYWEQLTMYSGQRRL